ncbi:uncharacterized protein BO95DRAFT_392409 [Aspergillus brunneoviolaceus CBS 621.78]|uniref:Uncharacterized protein n=1 Tax=Aspergillus brunneoviolaceus CBS 621.78 TaxID=1450534 RepID=A0ACD1G4Y9_9EURO|nr:hypothetical protein BO95DRAFT_392409 [Aspergillus brunneoviolaceus CBS 621.78]RAH44221.1 hypothetical protein BO95DRAFT_392409 [Aspergillus brunneoviolaceus CBS 621.78]
MDIHEDKHQSNFFTPADFVDQVASGISVFKVNTSSDGQQHEQQQQEQYPACGESPSRGFSALHATQIAGVKSLMLALHCLFPNELLLALDILDRGLVRRLVSTHDATNRPTTQASSVRSTEDVFLVNSTSGVLTTQPSSRYHPYKTDSETKAYEVRLQAWSCTCPTFTLASFRGPLSPAPEMTSLSTVATASAIELSPRRDYAISHGSYPFGGMLARGSVRSSPPVCKHLLASWLAVRCPSLLGKGNDGFVCVSAEELAGWCAGWGG